MIWGTFRLLLLPTLFCPSRQPPGVYNTYPVVVKSLHGREGGALAGVRLVGGGEDCRDGGERGQPDTDVKDH